MSVVDEFHKHYYNSNKWGIIDWFGIPIFKNPFDLQIYQELIFKVQPDLIIETGTALGGSALWFAHMLDILGKGSVITIDFEVYDRPVHPRIEYWTASSTSIQVISELKNRITDQNVMVVLDSDHEKGHVLRELKLYKDFVTPGSYLIVEDTNIHGHPVKPESKPGPYEAIAEFLKTNQEFKIDKECEKLEFTFNPNGYLLKESNEKKVEA